MKTFKTRATITRLERGNNSYYGNPSYFVEYTDCNGYHHNGKTTSNASCAYMLCSSCIGQTYDITYHITNAGNLRIDYIEKQGE